MTWMCRIQQSTQRVYVSKSVCICMQTLLLKSVWEYVYGDGGVVYQRTETCVFAHASACGAWQAGGIVSVLSSPIERTEGQADIECLTEGEKKLFLFLFLFLCVFSMCMPADARACVCKSHWVGGGGGCWSGNRRARQIEIKGEQEVVTLTNSKEVWREVRIDSIGVLKQFIWCHNNRHSIILCNIQRLKMFKTRWAQSG